MISTTKTILLTGASGLLGSHILLELVEKGFHVRCLVRDELSSKNSLVELANWYRIDPALLEENVSFFYGDITEIHTIEDALIDVSHVIHAAAIVSTKKQDRDLMFKVNVEGTSNVVNACLYSKIEKLIYISSVATLGPNPDDLVDEDYFFKQSPNTSAYALSKYAAEQEVWRGMEEGLNALILNPAFIIGPSRRLNSSASIFYALKKGLPGYISGASGYVDARDVATATVMGLMSDVQSKRFILCARNFKSLVFLKIVANSLGVSSPTWKVPNYLLPLIVLGSKLTSVFSRGAIQLTWDGIRMAKSFNAFDGRRFQTFFPNFYYRSIEVSIQETSAFINKPST